MTSHAFCTFESHVNCSDAILAQAGLLERNLDFPTHPQPVQRGGRPIRHEHGGETAYVQSRRRLPCICVLHVTDSPVLVQHSPKRRKPAKTINTFLRFRTINTFEISIWFVVYSFPVLFRWRREGTVTRRVKLECFKLACDDLSAQL